MPGFHAIASSCRAGSDAARRTAHAAVLLDVFFELLSRAGVWWRGKLVVQVTMSAAAQPQVPQKQLPKVLRIGVVQEGKIAQERLIRFGEVVTVGDGLKATFAVQGLGLGPAHQLFVPSAGSYALVVPESIEGKISWKDGIRDLSDLRTRGEMQKRGAFWALQLTESVRGKIALGNTTLLFQFVNAPPEPVRAVSSADFKARLFDDEDPLFIGLLGLFNGIAVLFYGAILLAPPPAEPSMEQRLQAAINLIVEVPPIPPEVPEQGPVEKPEEAKQEAKQEPETKAEAAVETKSEAAPTIEQLEQKSVLLQLLGTSGAGSDQLAEDIFGDQAAASGDLDAALKGVSGAELATASSVGLKQGSGGGTGDIAIGITNATVGKVSTGEGVAIVVKRAKIESDDAGDIDVEEGDADAVQKTVRGNRGRIETCLGNALKQDPSTSGRVGVTWTIVKGKVNGAKVLTNTTNNTVLGTCISNAVRGMKFPEEFSGTVDEYAWVLAGQ